MPDPFFSQQQPGQYWLEDLNAWNQNRQLPFWKRKEVGLNPPEAYRLLGDGRDADRDQEMMDMILNALLSDKGLAAYYSALGVAPTPTPTPTPTNDLQAGINETKKKRDPVAAADLIAYGP